MKLERLWILAVLAAACGKSGGSSDGMTPIGSSGVRVKLPESGTLEAIDAESFRCRGGSDCDARIDLHKPMVSSYSLDANVREAGIVGDLGARVERLPSGLVVFSVQGDPATPTRSGLYFVQSWLPDERGTATYCYGVGHTAMSEGIAACRSLVSTVKPAETAAAGPGPSAPPPPKP